MTLETSQHPALRRARRGEPARRKADIVAHDLLTQVVWGEIAVGSVLPRESELAARYAVNRSVVREAVKLLEVHRLVQPARRRGTVVLDPLQSLSPEVLRAMLRRPDGTIDRRVLAGLLEIRSALDVQMTTLAATRRTDEDLAALETLVGALRAAPHEAFARARRELPLLIARATQNPIFEMLAHWNDLVVRDLDEIFASVQPPRTAYVQGVALLVDLLRRREVESVRSVVQAFHAWVTPRLLAAAALASGEPLPPELARDAPHSSAATEKENP